ncbi:hypothetical protein [Paracidovorax citrulli]
MLEVIGSWPGPIAPSGFRYPSRKHKNHAASAIHSGALETWRRNADVEATPFVQLAAFELLRSDANDAEPFAGGFCPP